MNFSRFIKIFILIFSVTDIGFSDLLPMQSGTYFRCQTRFVDGQHCVICLSTEVIQETGFVFALDCDHEVHLECFKKWIRTSPTCPLCRAVPMQFLETYMSFNPDNCLLHNEVLRGDDDTKVLEQLLKVTRIDVNKRSELFGLPLEIAVQLNKIHKLQVLLEDKRIDKDTRMPKLLRKAAFDGSKDVLFVLLNHAGKHIASIDKFGQNLLHVAVMMQNTNDAAAILRKLLTYSEIDPNLKDFRDCTPLCLAVGGTQPGITKFLLAHNRVDPNQSDTYQRQCMKEKFIACQVYLFGTIVVLLIPLALLMMLNNVSS